MDVKFQKLLIKKSWDTANEDKAKGNESLYEIFKAQAERLEKELKSYLSSLPKKKVSKRKSKRK